MKKLVAFAAFAAAVVATSALADRTDIWSNATATVHQVELRKLGDGGCVVQATGIMIKQDGGISLETSRPVEVSGANQTACLDIINTKAPVLFKSDKGL